MNVRAAAQRMAHRRRFGLLPTCLVVVAFALLTPARAHAVIGGKPLRASRYPALVQVIANDLQGGRGTLCGGGLITPRVVVTAAHCLGTNPDTLRRLKPFAVVSGRQRAYVHQNPQRGVSIGADRVARAPANPRLHEPFSDDVALLHLRRPAPFTPFALASAAAARAGARVQVVGWGLTNPNQSGLGGIQLHGTTMRVRSNPACQVASGHLAFNAATQLCVTPGGPPRGTCEGDSGTPLLSTNGRSVLGVVSTGSGICGRGASI
jgi:secreted trypsin-like serine protease